MKRTTVIPIFALLAVSTASAQTFDLGWNTIDGGGATISTGGIYELAGTIGQPDAGSFSPPMIGGIFELVGGFWPAATPAPCPGDLNGDRQVDLTDLAALLSHFGTASGATLANGDLDGDGDVDLSDLATLLSHFGTVCP